MSAIPKALARLSAAVSPEADLDTALLSAAARAAVQRGELKGARALLLVLLSRDPGHEAAWCFLALVLRDLGERDDAVFAAQRALEIAPADLFARSVGRALGLMETLS